MFLIRLVGWLLLKRAAICLEKLTEPLFLFMGDNKDLLGFFCKKLEHFTQPSEYLILKEVAWLGSFSPHSDIKKLLLFFGPINIAECN
jgi:hypothetical protein